MELDNQELEATRMKDNIDGDIKIVEEFIEEVQEEYSETLVDGKVYRIENIPIEFKPTKGLAKSISNVLSELKELRKENKKLRIYEHLYEKVSEDFENYKNDKDINYLDGIHHKKLVEKSIGQIIDKPEECWFDVIEVKVIKDGELFGIGLNEDFINLKQISDADEDNCITVIAESTLSGAIYRYNNNGNKEWQLIGIMLGYA